MMSPFAANRLKEKLEQIDRKGYKAYQAIRGSYSFPGFTLHIDHVQGDPFASPSRIRVIASASYCRFPEEYYSTKSSAVAMRDYITRSFASLIRSIVKGRRGSGKSGIVAIDTPGQEILDRSSCFVERGDVEVRLRVGLPAAGRRILAAEAAEMLFTEIPRLVEFSMRYDNLDKANLRRQIETNENQDFLRAKLSELSLVAFIADDSILPRRSGVDDRPLQASEKKAVVSFKSPPEMRIEVRLPHGGIVSGMGIPEGITLIVGGGFHGKSTLLKAVERGVYNHVPGDGRELVVTREDAVKIKSEDGRSVVGVDIRPFIGNLPFGAGTSNFVTENASGSTSQAANIIEALEAGSRLLLMDEDTSATNFMIRDERMQALVSKESEPITPFLDKVTLMKNELNVSTILVMGGSGDYFDVADRVIMMDRYTPVDVTKRAKEIVSFNEGGRVMEGGDHFGLITERVPLKESFDASRGRRDVRIDTKGLREIVFGKLAVDVSALEQLVDVSQTRAIGDMIHYYSVHHAGKEYPLREGLARMMTEIESGGFDMLSPFKEGAYAMPRIFEVAAAVNRMRSLKVRQL